MKGDLSIKPIHHRTDERIEAHIFVAFMAYCLMVTVKYKTKKLALGLTPKIYFGKIFYHANGRCSPTNNRWTAPDFTKIYTTRQGYEAPSRTT